MFKKVLPLLAMLSLSLCACSEQNTIKDADGDGVADEMDKCPQDPNKTSPGECGCGSRDLKENGITKCEKNGIITTPEVQNPVTPIIPVDPDHAQTETPDPGSNIETPDPGSNIEPPSPNLPPDAGSQNQPQIEPNQPDQPTTPDQPGIDDPDKPIEPIDPESPTIPDTPANPDPLEPGDFTQDYQNCMSALSDDHCFVNSTELYIFNASQPDKQNMLLFYQAIQDDCDQSGKYCDCFGTPTCSAEGAVICKSKSNHRVTPSSACRMD